MKNIILASIVIPVGVLVASCGQPPVTCTVSPALPYAAKYTLTSGDGACAELPGDLVGFGAYNPQKVVNGEVQPDLNQVSMAIRTNLLGSQVAFALDNGVVDATEGHAPHAFGPFVDAFPDANGICRPDLAPAEQTLAAVEEDLGDPEDPDDDIPAQAATSVKETWTDVEVFVTAAALGTQVKGTYTLEQDGCTATYDVIALFPEVFCSEIVPDPDLAAIAIVSIDDSGPDGTVEVQTDGAHNLAAGDVIEISGVDDDERSFDGTYTVLTVTDDTFTTAEIDPFDGDDPDPAGDSGEVQRLVEVGNADLCSAVAIPEKGLPTGSGISPDFPVVCDPELFLCVIDPTQDPDGAFPFLKGAGG
jgi:hypothetical protein